METQTTIASCIQQLLEQIDDPKREGLRQTPERFESFLHEFLKPDKFKLTTFANEGMSEMVIQRQIPFFSLCEHHLLPFFGHGAIAYLPEDKIVGLSKLARTLENFSRRLQNQERITVDVGKYLMSQLRPKGVGVILHGRHLCMEMRGVRKPETVTTTSYLAGIFKTNPATRSEFLQLTQAGF